MLIRSAVSLINFIIISFVYVFEMKTNLVHDVQITTWVLSVHWLTGFMCRGVAIYRAVTQFGAQVS